MEGKNPQKSKIESNLFKIPIEKYEKDIETESVKGKKNEILDLLKNYNQLRSEKEFKENEHKLHTACREGDVDLIKIYLCEAITYNSNTFQFKIDSTNRTASLFKVNDYNKKVSIPRTVEHESVEYLITSITGTSRSLKKLKFVEDSAVETIYSYAFPSYSEIEEIYFPTSLKELKEGWCCNTKHLNKITISPSNGQFRIEEDKYLIGKSDTNKDEFDKLLFACRDIKEISIPSNIKTISSYAFKNCMNLSNAEIPPNSNLQTIGLDALFCTCITEISIPSKVLNIGDGTFSNCSNLTKVVIPTNSNLQTIGSNVFSFTKVRKVYFPASLKELKEGWCCFTENLNKITISPSNSQFRIEEDKYLIGKSDTNIDEFDKLLFACRDIKEISIPSNINIISSYAFQNCYKLIKVEIPSNSNLQTIDKYAFSNSKINEIFIPSKVSKICGGVFFNCNNLQIIEISEESKLESFPFSAFDGKSKCIIMIPASLEKLIQANRPI